MYMQCVNTKQTGAVKPGSLNTPVQCIQTHWTHQYSAQDSLTAPLQCTQTHLTHQYSVYRLTEKPVQCTQTHWTHQYSAHRLTEHTSTVHTGSLNIPVQCTQTHWISLRSHSTSKNHQSQHIKQTFRFVSWSCKKPIRRKKLKISLSSY